MNHLCWIYVVGGGQLMASYCSMNTQMNPVIANVSVDFFQKDLDRIDQ